MLAANDELRRLLEAGEPVDGDFEPLFRAIHAAEFHLPVQRHGEQEIPMMMGSRDRPSVVIFTHRELVPPLPPTAELTVVRAKEICLRALENDVASVVINPSGPGFQLTHAGMIDVASGIVPTREGRKLVEPMQISFVMPSRRPDEGFLMELTRLGSEHGLSELRWSLCRLGEAPIQLALFFSPHPHREFTEAVGALLSEATEGRGTFLDFDLALAGDGASGAEILL